MPRYAWLTDIHLNFVGVEQVARLCTSILDERPDGVLISGDIAEAPSLAKYLHALEHALELPIWFVLGNHDFYKGSAAAVRQLARELTTQSQWLRWLPAAGVVELGPYTGLVGHDGWADGRCGDYFNSDVLLNDYWLIKELAGLSSRERLDQLHAFGDEAAQHLRSVLPEALARYRTVYVVIHPPPFAGACWHEGRNSGPNWLPHLACGAAGAVLRELMAAHPDRDMKVFCGHTHGVGMMKELPNLEVLTGGAEYGNPRIQQVREVD